MKNTCRGPFFNLQPRTALASDTQVTKSQILSRNEIWHCQCADLRKDQSLDKTRKLESFYILMTSLVFLEIFTFTNCSLVRFSTFESFCIAIPKNFKPFAAENHNLVKACL